MGAVPALSVSYCAFVRICPPATIGAPEMPAFTSRPNLAPRASSPFLIGWINIFEPDSVTSL